MSWRVISSEILFLLITRCSFLFTWIRIPYHHISHKLKFLISLPLFLHLLFILCLLHQPLNELSVINRKDPALLIETQLSISHLDDTSLMMKEDLPWWPENCRIIGSLGGGRVWYGHNGETWIVLLNNISLSEIRHLNFTDFLYWHQKYDYLRKKAEFKWHFKIWVLCTAFLPNILGNIAKYSNKNE